MRSVTQRKKKWNMLRTRIIIKRRKANSIGHIYSSNCILKPITEGKVGGGTEVRGRQE
jgi:hypothetical protein